ncbi:uncharacterized protein PV09_05987 [Verruconis gallopava]|uniref:VHS domain-containing protein n=1 Tax=Verruconis gallopava TaxID=253628 RepID=A0A0D1XKT6_9PEZI|nr:uncharacterized protein PV09_05987 [Verruconis gallopava]KIW02941.1 hypothetical protein PV09_05987 [Verruconis gallopava]
MEAASYRAARDRWGGYGEAPQTPLQRYITNACDPQNFEPNLALNLEIVDMINNKKGNAPREAAIAIVGYVNHRNPNVSMLALNLLDICVKNCGYAFHLQISTKEFLNELVRRFPERPPAHPSRSMMKILELIEEWRSTICQTSRYKEDLGFIRDMHRLLSYKGYVFPEVRREDAAVLNSSETLRSAEEMEEEERAAQSAKLQELIRRGTPHDLQEANKLMKVMAGYDTRNKTDWRAKAAEEVVKVQQKAKLLEDMLQKHQAGEDLDAKGDVFEELATALMSAHPKIQKMCEEESDDHEAVAKLFEINDSIHRTIERYKLTKKGDLDAAAKIPAGTLGTSGAGVRRGNNNELSLIDLGGPEDTQPVATPAQSAESSAQPKKAGNALEDDLLGLSIGGETYGQGGALSLGGSNGFASQPGSTSQPHLSNAQITSMFNQPGQQQPSPAPQTSAFGGMPTFSPPMSSSSRPSSTAPNVAPSPKPDPFAALSTHTPRGASPFQFQQSIQAPAQPSQASNDPFGLAQSITPQQHQASTATPTATAATITGAAATDAAADDEWTFASALPAPSTSNTLTIASASVAITWAISRSRTDPAQIDIASSVSNSTQQPISEFTFQVAVSKAYKLRLEPQSGRDLAPAQRAGITQRIFLLNVPAGEGGKVKMRWKATFVVGGQRKEEMGEVSSLGVD